MSKKTALLLSIVYLTIYSSSAAFASDLPYKLGELIVHFAPKPDSKQRTEAERTAILATIDGGTVKDSSKFVPGLTLVRIPDNLTVESALPVFKNADGILSVQPNYIYKADSTFPNDPNFGKQWALHNTGRQTDRNEDRGTRDADIDAPEAWDVHTGSNDIIVAVIDTGVDYNHPDLAGNMWVNPGEIPDNDIDDDNNGYIDDVYGWDFAYDDNDPNDDRCHGTHCAGIIGSIGDNDEGVTGVCWNVKIMALKFMNIRGEGTTWDATDSIRYAVKMGAKVLSNSWGGGVYDPNLKATIQDADANGVLFIASAGNSGDNIDNPGDEHYPASYDCNNIIAVMATDHDDKRSIWSVWNSSNYGPISVDLAAPGTDILSTMPRYETGAMSDKDYSTYYERLSGTSMAAPHVAGACALAWSVNPWLDHLEVKDIVLDTVDEIDTLDGLCVTDGRLNLHKALLEAGKQAGLLGKTDNVDPNNSVLPDDSITYTISYENNLKDPNDPNLPFGTLTNVEIVDYLPPEVDYTPSSDPNYDPNNHTYTWDIGTVEPNESNSVTLTVTVNESAVPLGTITNVCVIDANEILPTTAVETTDVNCWDAVIYADKDANDFGNGMSWENAYNYLEDALFEADRRGCGSCNSQIWTAAGTYIPTEDHDEGVGMEKFQLINGVALYGGFAGTETSLSQRDLSDPNNETILTGDIDGDSDTDVYYVVKASDVNETAIIDGFTITKGYEAGIRCENNGSPTIRNNKITQNGHSSGDGGIYCLYSDPNVINCAIEDNTDGIYCKDNSSVVVRNSEIKNNNWYGIYCESSELNLANCRIENNGSYGLYCKSVSPFITNTIVRNNNNHGIYIYETSPTVAPVIKNSWICDNGTSNHYGIGLLSVDSVTVIRNTTVANNAGYGIAWSGGPDPNISNCIVWNNGDDLYGCAATYSCIKNDDTGEGNIHNDPCFVDVNDYHLSYDSPCEDAGDPDFDPDPNETDIDGELRVMGDCNEIVDMGADEIYFPHCWNYLTQCHADADGDGFVGTADWPPFRDGFGNSYPTQAYIDNVCADYDRDGDIDTIDWPVFRDNFSKEVPADCNCGCAGAPCPDCWPPECGGGGEGSGQGQSSGDTAGEPLPEDMIDWIIEHELPGWEEFIRRLYE